MTGEMVTVSVRGQTSEYRGTYTERHDGRSPSRRLFCKKGSRTQADSLPRVLVALHNANKCEKTKKKG